MKYARGITTNRNDVKLTIFTAVEKDKLLGYVHLGTITYTSQLPLEKGLCLVLVNSNERVMREPKMY